MGFDPVIEWVIKPYMAAKRTRSIDFCKGLNRSLLPRIAGGPEAINKYIGENFPYHSDPWGGLYDVYVDPRCLHWAKENNCLPWYPNDCDDYACMAYQLLIESGHDSTKGHLNNLLISNIWDIPKNHVICTFEHNDQIGVIDTCTASWGMVKWFENNTYAPASIKEFYGHRDVYNVQYAYL